MSDRVSSIRMCRAGALTFISSRSLGKRAKQVWQDVVFVICGRGAGFEDTEIELEGYGEASASVTTDCV